LAPKVQENAPACDDAVLRGSIGVAAAATSAVIAAQMVAIHVHIYIYI